MTKFKDSNDIEALIEQVGFVKASIDEVNRQIGKLDKEINSMPKRKIHLEKMKDTRKKIISKKHKYLNELQSQIETIKNNNND